MIVSFCADAEARGIECPLSLSVFLRQGVNGPGTCVSLARLEASKSTGLPVSTRVSRLGLQAGLICKEVLTSKLQSSVVQKCC